MPCLSEPADVGIDHQRPSPRRRAAAAVFAALLAATVGAAAGLPGAAGVVTLGSDLSKAANWPFGCEARPYPGLGGMQLLSTGTTSCMWWPAPLTAAATYVPLGDGHVVAARVRSGPSPAPLRISIVSSGGGLCCTSRASSAVFQPTPNAVTSVPLSLPAGAGLDPNRPGSQYNDIVVVSAVGPGTLPVHDNGVHGSFNTSGPAAAFLNPELTDGNSNTDVGWMDGFEVLLQVDWEPNAAGGPAPGPGSDPGAAPGTGPAATGPAPTGPAPVAPRRAAGPSGLKLNGRTLAVTVPAAGVVRARFERCGNGRCRTVARLSRRARRGGAVRLALPRTLRPGAYRVTVTAAGARRRLVRRVVVRDSARRPRR